MSAPRTSTPRPAAPTPARSRPQMLAGLATWCHRRPLRAPPGPGRDRRAHRPQARALRGGRPAADPVRRRAARGARSRPRRGDRPGAAGGRARGRAARTVACPADLVIAYEPVWAIGTGLTARGADAAAMADAIRATRGGARRAGRRRAASRCSTAAASRARSIGEFLAEPAIDGALVGGASLKVDEMAGIVARAGDDRGGPRRRPDAAPRA